MLKPSSPAFPGSGAAPRPVLLATFLLAFAVLFFEIALTRIFSVIAWHHFTPMIIGTALLGLGLAGSIITARLRRDPGFLGPAFVARSAFAFAWATIGSLLLITRIDFEPLLVGKDWTQLISLLALILLLVAPFLFAGLALGGIVTLHQRDIGRVYFADLFGASLGALACVPAIAALGATNMAFLVALIAGVAGLVLDAPARGLTCGPNLAKVALLAAVLAAGLKFDPYLVHVPPSKPLAQYANRTSGAGKLESSRWDAVGRIDVVKPFERTLSSFSGDLAPTEAKVRWPHLFICQDGQSCTGSLRSDGAVGDMTFLNGYLQAAPYVLVEKPAVLVIGIGGGVDALIALYNGASHVTGVDVNPLVVETITRRRDFTGGIFTGPGVTVTSAEGRSFLSRTAARYDVIQLSGVDTLTALASGAYALAESYLYTTEAVRDYWRHLTPGGVLSFSRFRFDPPRENLRLAGTVVSGLEAEGIREPWRHLAIVRGPGWAETLLKRTPFSRTEIAALGSWAEANSFALHFDPFENRKTPFDALLRSSDAKRARFLQDYPYDVAPATDDRPYFFDYYRWKNLLRAGPATAEDVARAPLSLLTLLAGLALILLLAGAGILYPEFSAPEGAAARRGKTSVAVYFGALGLAFMVIEIGLIQQFMVFLGGPAYSLAVTLFAILLFSGLGSWWSRRLSPPHPHLPVALPILLLVLGVGVSGLVPPALPHLLGLGLMARAAAAVCLIAPLAFCMGIPLPFGIGVLSRSRPQLVPWAWAANSFMTVFGTLFTVFLGMVIGFRASFLVAGLVYLAGFLVFRPLVREDPAGQAADV